MSGAQLSKNNFAAYSATDVSWLHSTRMASAGAS